MKKQEDVYKPLPEEAQVEHYVKGFKDSSDRVRYVMITLTVACTLIFVGYNNTRRHAWFDSRVEIARAAADAWGPDTTDLNTVFNGLTAEIREVESSQGGDGEGQNPQKVYSVVVDTGLEPVQPVDKSAEGGLTDRAIQWAQGRGLKSRSSIEDVIRIMEEVRIQNANVMRMPILGLAFDINDLGLFSGISFVVLMVMLAFALSRYHENLFLSLWKVRQICKEEKRPSVRGSEANLVYHSLAMAQLFSKPPTLARPNSGAGKSLSKLVLLVPVSIQGLIFYHDCRTMAIGEIFDGSATGISVVAQSLCIAVVTGLTLVCLAYMRSSELRWRHTFYKINPCLEPLRQPPWLEWVSVVDPTRDYEAEYWEQYNKMHGEVESPPSNPEDESAQLH